MDTKWVDLQRPKGPRKAPLAQPSLSEVQGDAAGWARNFLTGPYGTRTSRGRLDSRR